MSGKSKELQTHGSSWRTLFDGLGWLILALIIILGQVCVPYIFNFH